MSISVQQIEKAFSADAENKKSSSWEKLLQTEIRLPGGKLNDKQKEELYSQMHLLVEAGVDLKTALELVVESQKKSAKELLEEINTIVLQGALLSQAMENFKEFTPYEKYSIKIGEESGTLVQVLEQLSTHFGKKIKQKRQLVSAMTYPVLVITAAMGVIGFMLHFMVPMFEDMFKNMDAELPAITATVIAISRGFSANIFWILGAIVAAVIFVIYNKEKSWYRKFSSSLLLRIPFFGQLIKTAYLARFCSSMAFLTGAGTPLSEALKLVEKMIGFYPVEVAMQTIRKKVMIGQSLAQALGEHPFFETRMVSIIRVSEEVNQLHKVFSKLAEQYGHATEQRTAMMNSVMEPIMIIVVGILVAIILVSMYLPMFQLSTSIAN